MEAYRGAILHFLKEPRPEDRHASYEYFEDGILIVEDGRIQSVGKSIDQIQKIPKEIDIKTYEKNHLILPGFVDAHIHFPQMGMIGSYGEQLLEWLDKYTFPFEMRFSDKKYAQKMATLFIDELLKNGTTTALVFCTAAKESVDALFESAQPYRMRLIAGRTLGDRNMPDPLLTPVPTISEQEEELIHRWHRNDRFLYAVTPRFAPTSSEELLKEVQNLLNKYPDLYLHTHLSENQEEISWVASLFPWSRNYLDVYHRFGLVRPRSVFAHAVHISDEEANLLADSKAAICHCPTSNLFLGSGLFRWKYCKEKGLKIAFGTDVGAGTSFSLFATMNEGYKIAQLQKNTMHPLDAFYHATIGGAKALYLDSHIGNFEPGKEADFVVLDLHATELMKRRMTETTNLSDRLFLLMMLGDDRNIKETYILGKQAIQKSEMTTHKPCKNG